MKIVRSSDGQALVPPAGHAQKRLPNPDAPAIAPPPSAPLPKGALAKTPAAGRPVGGTPALVATRVPAAVHPFVEAMRSFSQANAERLRQENLLLLADRPDPGAALAALEQEVRAGLEILVRRSARGFAGVLRDLRMKSAYEEPGKREAKYLEYREETERELGFFSHRPAYGYVSANALMRGAAAEFGDVIVTLKGVEARTTFCVFDSFDQGSRSAFEQQCFLWQDVAQLLVNQKLNRLFEDMPFAYDEAQVMEGVSAKDIGAVAIPSGEAYDELARQTRDVMPWVTVSRYDKPGERSQLAGGAAVSDSTSSKR